MVIFICMLIAAVGIYLVFFQKKKPPSIAPPNRAEITESVGSTNENDTKKCRHCAMIVPKKAKICPYCRKKIGITMPAMIAIVVIALAILGVFQGKNEDDTPKNKPSTPQISKPVSPEIKKDRTIRTAPAQPSARSSKPETQNNSYSGLATTTANSIGCFTRSDLEEMVKFTAAGDRESFAAYVSQRKCVVLPGGLDVTVVEYPGMFGGITGFVYRGNKMWSTREGVTNYR